MIVADLMTRQVLAIDPETPLVQAIHLMTEHKISGLPVVGQNGQVVGILTEGDLLRRVEIGTEEKAPGWLKSFFLAGREAENYVLRHGRRVGEVMTHDVITVAEDTPLPDVIKLMHRHHVKRIPVVQDGRLCGIISRADLVRRVGDILSAAPASASDDAIRQAISSAMDRELWAHGTKVSVAVQDGVVQIDGCLFDIRERQALGVLVENVPGVKRVENRIICIEPYMGTVTYDPNA
ncbi:MAG: CBS domain-containing protein [Acetobacteraceae bacterium]